MRRLAGGVAIVTTRLGEVRAGLTATSVCSLTAEPPRLLVCVHREADAHDLIHGSRVFAVNVLGPAHRELADRFGGREDSHGPSRFALGCWRSGAGGVPILADAAASFQCHLVEAVAAGTHTIFIGEVEAVVGQDGADGLVYHDRAYRRLAGLAG
jgi:flavin reductase (DIM6/NTAB) family NADH-FMN oxidoreductase RutF